MAWRVCPSCGMECSGFVYPEGAAECDVCRLSPSCSSCGDRQHHLKNGGLCDACYAEWETSQLPEPVYDRDSAIRKIAEIFGDCRWMEDETYAGYRAAYVAIRRNDYKNAISAARASAAQMAVNRKTNLAINAAMIEDGERGDWKKSENAWFQA